MEPVLVKKVNKCKKQDIDVLERVYDKNSKMYR